MGGDGGVVIGKCGMHTHRERYRKSHNDLRGGCGLALPRPSPASAGQDMRVPQTLMQMMCHLVQGFGGHLQQPDAMGDIGLRLCHGRHAQHGELTLAGHGSGARPRALPPPADDDAGAGPGEAVECDGDDADKECDDPVGAANFLKRMEDAAAKGGTAGAAGKGKAKAKAKGKAEAKGKAKAKAKAKAKGKAKATAAPPVKKRPAAAGTLAEQAAESAYKKAYNAKWIKDGDAVPHRLRIAHAQRAGQVARAAALRCH